VAACLRHLLRSEGAGPAPRAVLVGHSMGGLVLQAALDQLEALDPGFDVARRAALLLTLGAPTHHLPSFVPPHRQAQANTSSYPAWPVAVPALHVLAGPGDVMVPALSAWRQPSPPGIGRRRAVHVDLEDVPGAWCTTSHKGLVSCNQLVRRVVPLLLAAAQLAAAATADDVARQRGATEDTLRALRWRMTTHVDRALPATSADAEGAVERCAQPHRAAEAPAPPRIVDTALHSARLAPGAPRKLRWLAAQHGVRQGALLLLASGAKPCLHFRVEATTAEGASVELSHLAAPLPPLLPALQGQHTPR
jgi:hypothetical protein